MADAAKNLFKVVGGLILVLLPIWAAIRYPGWKQATLDVIQGSIVIGVILIGLLILILGITGMKE